ncbi:hypothetical protein D5086_031463 [Populus alba]|uniref:Uncharacterized protein n=1 Tax=Populus alba TaxID=43335 RepID=A0ACC4AIP2_POPAL
MMMMMKKKKAKLGGPLGNDLKRRDSTLFLMGRQTFGFYTNEKTVFTPLRESEPSILLTKTPSGNGDLSFLSLFHLLLPFISAWKFSTLFRIYSRISNEEFEEGPGSPSALNMMVSVPLRKVKVPQFYASMDNYHGVDL